MRKNGHLKMINIIVTSKPVDGLLHYSYEYCCALKAADIPARVHIITRRDYAPEDYMASLENKYKDTIEDVYINDYYPSDDKEVNMVMGHSMVSIPYRDLHEYDEDRYFMLHSLFRKKPIISVHSENDIEGYSLALEHFKIDITYCLCDKEVYPNGHGDHFEKTINFSLYKTPKDDIMFKYLFLGTNKEYYNELSDVVPNYESHGILTMQGEDYLNPDWNNVSAPVQNLMGMFETYVYNKQTFDPAPRIIMECKYFNKEIIYNRSADMIDGGSVYMNREPQEPNLEEIVKAYDELQRVG